VFVLGYAWFKHPFYLFLTAMYLFLVPGTVVAFSDYYAFEPILFFVGFGILSATDNIRVTAILASGRGDKLCDPVYYYCFVLGTTFLFMGLMAVYYFLVRSFFFTTFLDLEAVPSYVRLYLFPWLYVSYVSCALYFVNFNLVFFYLSDLFKAREVLVDTIPKTTREILVFIRGCDNSVVGIFIGLGAFLGVWVYVFPILHVIDEIWRGDIFFVGRVVVWHAVFTFSISVAMFLYLTYGILKGEYYHYQVNCMSRRCVSDVEEECS